MSGGVLSGSGGGPAILYICNSMDVDPEMLVFCRNE